ncbi:MAG: SDR family oxidoreductase [Dehalococcoidia bacterium]|nr:MAG: SDR family oxidoreductase [Dehalococcoidia bacterium]
MKSIVITGSTSGIGLGLADAFLSLGCSVTISGRSQAKLEKAYRSLLKIHSKDRLFYFLCNVQHYDQVQDLWNTAKDHFGNIHIWINNAGISHPETDIHQFSPKSIKEVIDTNLLGAIYGSKVALKGMMDQGFGGIYNVEGLGSSGPIIRGLALYGTTKAAISYLTKSMAKETKDTPILVGALRPGMVATKLITDQYIGYPDKWERSKRIFNILSDRVEVVTPWLARKVLANKKNGASIVWLSRWKIFKRFLMAPFDKREIFEDLV